MKLFDVNFTIYQSNFYFQALVYRKQIKPKNLIVYKAEIDVNDEVMNDLSYDSMNTNTECLKPQLTKRNDY